jgi:hypothetical protein
VIEKNMDDEDNQEEDKKDDGCSERGERSNGRREKEKEKDVGEGTGAYILSSFR